MKKPFAETKLGQFVDKAKPIVGDVLGFVGDLTGIEAIEKIGDFIDGKAEESAEAKALQLEFERLKVEFELEAHRIESNERIEAMKSAVEEMKIAQADTDSARNMRNEMTRMGKIDWAMMVFGCVALLAWLYFIWYMSWYEIPLDNKEAFADMRTSARDVFILMAGYFFGSSLSSKRSGDAIRTIAAKK